MMTERLITIIIEWTTVWYVWYDKDGLIITEWSIWDNTYSSWVDMLKWLRWHWITMDHLYF